MLSIEGAYLDSSHQSQVTGSYACFSEIAVCTPVPVGIPSIGSRPFLGLHPVSISDIQVRFYSLVGKQVEHFSGQTSFDLSNLSKGVYIVEVIQGCISIGKQKIVVTR